LLSLEERLDDSAVGTSAGPEQRDAAVRRGDRMVRMVNPSVLVVCIARRLTIPIPNAARTSATRVVG
jgi:hypothetical protein